MPLAPSGQLEFSGGFFRALARHLIPENAAWEVTNGLLDDDGSIYRRGGSEYLSTSAFGAAGLRAIADVFLSVGQRSVVANPDDWGVLASDDLSVVNLGGSGLSEPRRLVELGGLLFAPGGMFYGGSRKAADYSTGTVTTTNGSATVTGAGTSWLANIDAGMIFRTAAGERSYVVASVGSDTSLTLRDPYEGSSAGGKAYTLSRLGDASAAPYKTGDCLAVAGNRLWVGKDDRVDFSEGPSATGVLRPHSFGANDFWRLPEGTRILAMEELRGVLFLFTTGGIFAIHNTAFDLIDPAGNPQQRLDQVNRDVIVWGQSGIASWGNALVVPGIDHVFLFDGVSRPEPISRSIAPVLREYVELGYRPGGAAVYRSHYFLPILDGSNALVDLLVCRLDRPVRTPVGLVYPWVQVSGSGGQVTALAVRVGQTTRQPQLLGAGRQTTSRVLKLTGFFDPEGVRKNDHDATTHTFRLVTRDYATGPLNRNTVRRMRLRYLLEDAASDNPTISAFVSVGVKQAGISLWGAFNWAAANWSDASTAEDEPLTGSAPEDDGRTPYVWPVNKKARYVRFRIESTTPAAKLTVRSIELFTRPGSRRR